MQDTWPAVALAATAAIFVGAIVGVRRSGSAVQSRAIGWSLCSLALVSAIGCVGAAFGLLASITWFFAAVLVIVPAAVYACVVLVAQSDASSSPTSVRSGQARVATSSARGRVARKEPRSVSIEGTRLEPAAAPRVPRFVPLEVNDTRSTVKEPTERAVAQQLPAAESVVADQVSGAAKSEFDVEACEKDVRDSSPAVRRTPANAYPPPLGEVKAASMAADEANDAPASEAAFASCSAVEPSTLPEPAFEAEAEPAMDLEPSPECEHERESETELLSESEPESAPAPEQAPAPEAAPAPASLPEPAPAPTSRSLDPTADGCFQKAAAFKARGLHVPAARLFAEAAALADGDTARRRARFEELSCYIKADQPEKARPLVEELGRCSVLTKVERVKLDAARRLL